MQKEKRERGEKRREPYLAMFGFDFFQRLLKGSGGFRRHATGSRGRSI
jgi:hypothetical protein